MFHEFSSIERIQFIFLMDNKNNQNYSGCPSNLNLIFVMLLISVKFKKKLPKGPPMSKKIIHRMSFVLI